MYGFARRPLWLLSHLFVLALILAMLWAGFWQWGRRAEVRERNERIVARTAVAEASLTDLIDADLPLDEVSELEFRRVTVTGEFDRSEEVLVRNRPFQGAPGSWALTPLVLADGTAVLVNRGWIPRSYTPDGDRAAVDPPPGTVTVNGWLRPTETRQGLQAGDAPTGDLTSVARPDIARLRQQIDYELFPGFVQAEVVDNSGATPVPLALPELTDGPHLSYAAQWAIFATIGIVGYPLILRRVARNRLSLARDEELVSETAHSES